jgi:hypothetical protein
MQQAVIFLARGLGGGVESARAFFESYRRYGAGMPHELVVLMKGWDGVPGRADVERMAAELSASVIDLPDDGYDWGAYMRAAAVLPHEWFCFLNTHSRILAPDWLAKLRHAAEPPQVAIAGATGSLGSPIPSLRLMPSRLRFIFAKKSPLMAWLTAAFIVVQFPWERVRYLMNFVPVPNPFLRTNGFLIRREDFLAFRKTTAIPRRKREAFIIEFGRRSLSRFFYAAGRVCVVAGADGQVFLPPDWAESGTYCVPGQHNLLIADNRTRIYETAGLAERCFMEDCNWGRVLSAGGAPRPAPE